MKFLINLFLILLIGLLGYMLYQSIKEPVKFGETKNYRKNVVVDKLQKIRTAQELYRSIKGGFAGSWDDLVMTLKTDSIPHVKTIGDPDDPTNSEKFQRIVTYTPAIDTVRALGLDLDNLAIVPFSGGKKFDITADSIEYQKTTVSVVEVGTPWKSFMGEFGDPKFRMYDKMYDPNKKLKFGDLTKPNLSGNWE